MQHKITYCVLLILLPILQYCYIQKKNVKKIFTEDIQIKNVFPLFLWRIVRKKIINMHIRKMK